MGEKYGDSINFWHHQMEWLLLFGQSKSKIKVHQPKASLEDKSNLLNTHVAERNCEGTRNLYGQIACWEGKGEN